jgi:glycerol kinase
MNILKTNIDQDAASLGAMAIAARAAGAWTDYSPIEELHKVEQLHEPEPGSRYLYERIMERYMAWTESLAKLQP